MAIDQHFPDCRSPRHCEFFSLFFFFLFFFFSNLSLVPHSILHTLHPMTKQRNEDISTHHANLDRSIVSERSNSVKGISCSWLIPACLLSPARYWLVPGFVFLDSVWTGEHGVMTSLAKIGLGGVHVVVVPLAALLEIEELSFLWLSVC